MTELTAAIPIVEAQASASNDTEGILPLPRVGSPSSFQEMIKLSDYTKGFSIGSIVGYVRGELNFITPAANADYIEGKEDNWNNLVSIIRQLDKEDKENTIKNLYDMLKSNQV